MTQLNKPDKKFKNPEFNFLWVRSSDLSSFEFDVKSEKESDEKDQKSDPRKRRGC